MQSEFLKHGGSFTCGDGIIESVCGILEVFCCLEFGPETCVTRVPRRRKYMQHKGPDAMIHLWLHCRGDAMSSGDWWLVTVCLRTWGEAEKGKADGVGKWEKGKLCIARSRCCLSRPHKRELVKIHGTLGCEVRTTGSYHDFYLIRGGVTHFFWAVDFTWESKSWFIHIRSRIHHLGNQTFVSLP